jgi:hypothetical protein
MTEGHIYTAMNASKFPDQQVALQYVRFISDNIAPRVAAGATSARLIVPQGENGDISSCESQYTWFNKATLEAYRASEGAKIRAEVRDAFPHLKLIHSQGRVALEKRI